MTIQFSLTFHLVGFGESSSDFKTEATVNTIEDFHAVLDAVNQEVLKIMETLTAAGTKAQAARA